MAQVINTYMTSLNSQRHLNNTNSALSKAMERLSSGKRIKRPKAVFIKILKSTSYGMAST